MKKNNFGLWIVGQLAALGVAVLLTHEYNFAIGFAVFFALCVLVDIRGNL